jgi:hypothetical protein
MRDAASCDRPKHLAIIRYQRALGGTAQAMRFFQYRIEHECQIAARGIDGAQHLCRGGLTLARLVKFAGLTPNLVLEIGNKRAGSALHLCRTALPRLCSAARFRWLTFCRATLSHRLLPERTTRSR